MFTQGAEVVLFLAALVFVFWLTVLVPMRRSREPEEASGSFWSVMGLVDVCLAAIILMLVLGFV
jgi:hypothetical protein